MIKKHGLEKLEIKKKNGVDNPNNNCFDFLLPNDETISRSLEEKRRIFSESLFHQVTPKKNTIHNE